MIDEIPPLCPLSQHHVRACAVPVNFTGAWLSNACMKAIWIKIAEQAASKNADFTESVGVKCVIAYEKTAAAKEEKIITSQR